MIADDIAGREPVVRITELAREKVLRVRAGQPNPERLALRIEVIGISGGEYESTASLPLLEDAGPDDVVQHHDGLAIVIPADHGGGARDHPGRRRHRPRERHQPVLRGGQEVARRGARPVPR